jgi:hypothetical protein
LASSRRAGNPAEETCHKTLDDIGPQPQEHLENRTETSEEGRASTSCVTPALRQTPQTVARVPQGEANASTNAMQGRLARTADALVESVSDDCRDATTFTLHNIPQTRVTWQTRAGHTHDTEQHTGQQQRIQKAEWETRSPERAGHEQGTSIRWTAPNLRVLRCPCCQPGTTQVNCYL